MLPAGKYSLSFYTIIDQGYPGIINEKLAVEIASLIYKNFRYKV